MARTDYTVFEVRIRSRDQGGFEAEVLEGPCPRVSEPFRPPLPEAKTEQFLSRLERQVLGRGGKGGKKAQSPPRELERKRKARAALEPEEIGETLFRSLFQDRVSDALIAALTSLDSGGERARGVRILLTFGREDEAVTPIAALPWELLCQPDGSVASRHRFLSRNRETPILRYFDALSPRAALKIAPPLRILGVSSSPCDLPTLNLEGEWEEIVSELQPRDAFKPELLYNPRIDQLRDALLAEDWHVLHFFGHGDFAPEEGEGQVLFTGLDGDSEPVTGLMLGEILKASPSIRLVVLNLCKGGTLPRRRGQNPFFSAAPAILKAGIPAVIAMQFSISDRAAIHFSQRFYTRLAANDPVDLAATEARLTMYTKEPKSCEWITPAVFLGTRNSQILDLSGEKQSPVPGPAAAEGSAPATSQGKDDKTLRLGIRTYAGKGSFAPDMEQRTERMLCLGKYFNGPLIQDDAYWDSEILPQLYDFLMEASGDRRPIWLYLASITSVAFAAGYFLNAKSGLSITVHQPGRFGNRDWPVERPSSPEERLWLQEPDKPGSPEAIDVAYAISVTNPVLDDVENYLEASGLAVSRILMATLSPRPDNDGVRDGTHALQLAQSLYHQLRARTRREREGTLHIFLSAPHSVAFFFGQLCYGVGKIQLYEFGFNYENRYRPSLRLPYPPAPGA